MVVRVKICGVTSVADATFCAEAGADAIGLNFVAASARCVSLELAREIVGALPAHVLTVGVFVDADYEQLARTRDVVGLQCLQLHGDESPELLSRLLPHAYKALRVRDAALLCEAAARYPGEYLLVDTYVPGMHGGTGVTFDWGEAAALAKRRRVALAGGLHPQNVAAAVAAVAPFCVDVASGVEVTVGKKDEALVRAFVTRAKGERCQP